VMRHLVQRHGVELRQLRALAMGPVATAAGEKASAEALARARRVDMRLLTPWSSWEDAQTSRGDERPEPSALPEAAAGGDVPARRRLPEPLQDISPQDLGGE
jgi:hypothetical protein